MDYSLTTWLSTSLDLSIGNGSGNITNNSSSSTLRLLDDSRVRERKSNVKEIIVDYRSSSSNINDGSNHRYSAHDQAPVGGCSVLSAVKDEGVVANGNIAKANGGDLIAEELNRVSAENKKLTEMLVVVCEKYDALKTQLMDYMTNTSNNKNNSNKGNNICAPVLPSRSNHNISETYGDILTMISASKKRKSDSGHHNNNNNDLIGTAGESSPSDEDRDSCSKKLKGEAVSPVTKTTKKYVKTEPSDTSLILKDGYRWKKYGQKVTRDNPSPRAYFKCSFAPSCPVKKKVQRCLEDQSILVATYEGVHNHPPPANQPESTSSASGAGHNRSNMVLNATPISLSAGPATITLDLTRPKPVAATGVVENPSRFRSGAASQQEIGLNTPELQKFLVERMASSLTKDSNFTAALAAAISGRFLQQQKQNWNEKW